MSSVSLKMEVVVKSDVADPKQQQQLLQNQHFHVLAVDDSLLDRKLLDRLLRGSSYEVTCVDSGDEALKYLGFLEDLNRSTATSSSSSSPQSSDVPENSTPLHVVTLSEIAALFTLSASIIYLIGFFGLILMGAKPFPPQSKTQIQIDLHRPRP